MALKKRSKVDVSLLEENLPLNTPKLYEQNNNSLRKTLEQYRKENESLNSNNLLLSRKNDVLECLLSSVSSLWDSLNTDVDKFLSLQLLNKKNLENNKNNSHSDANYKPTSQFWEKLLNTKFPFVSSNVSDDGVELNELKYMFDNDEFLVPGELYDETEWEKTKKEFLDSKVNFLGSKKDKLLKSLSRASYDSKYNQSDVVALLKYNVLHYSKLFFLVYEKYKGLKSSYNLLKVDLSRLNKQNAFLKFELKRLSSDESKKDLESSSSSESEYDPPKLVENFEEVTEEMVLGSSLYYRLFNYAKNMDKEISRLESENSELRNKLSTLLDTPTDNFLNFKKELDALTQDLTDKVEAFSSKHLEVTNDLSTLKENYNFVEEELEQYKLERLKMVDELNQRDVTMAKLLRQNASICKTLSTNTGTTTSGGTSVSDGSSSAEMGSKVLCNPPNTGVEFYKEQLLNISEELEEVSMAFEKKQKMCDDLMRQMNEVESTRQKLAKLESSYNSLLDRFNKLVGVSNTKSAAQAKQTESLEKTLELYKNGWVYSYKRSCYLQHQRDVAQSALCELQSMYRKSCRSQKALQDYLSLTRTGMVRTYSMDNNLGDLNNVISQENEVLRRRMICSVCSENFKDQVITKCGHLFCHSCLNNNLKSRNRKCPQCKITFDKNDTQKIFLD